MQPAQRPLSPTTSPFSPAIVFTRKRADGCKLGKVNSVVSRRSFAISPVQVSNANCFAAAYSGGLEALKSAVNQFAKQWTEGCSTSSCSPTGEWRRDDTSEMEDCGTSLDCSSLAEKCGDGPSSPRQRLGSKWKEYAGCNDWEGLLDPLDANLRREIINYGEFVQATYSAFDFDPRSETYGRCKYSKNSLLTEVGLQSSGYRVTRHIHATSGVQVPRWVTALMSAYSGGDATWLSRQTSWMGFVAVCEDPKEIARMGRRNIVVAYRGTVTPLEWAENLRDILTPVATSDGGACVECDPKVHCEPKVQSGFWRMYTCKDAGGRSASSQVLDEIRRLLQLYEGEEVSITITGHSLGAALALLTAYQVGAADFRCRARRYVPITVFSFGGPRVGNRAFGRRMEEMGIKVLRVVNTQDVITRVPGVLLNETWMHCYLKKQQRSDNLRKIVEILERMPWAYWHVGTELQLNSKHSPYLKPDADMACCHDLEAYLHLIDGFFSSSTPFRASAKRDIVRLLVNQKSNVLLKAAKVNCHSKIQTGKVSF